ncbi:MAG: hypothetical protein ACTIMT_15220 [Marinomonadaceae bacterium]
MHRTAQPNQKKQRIMKITAICCLLLVGVVFFSLKYFGTRYATQMIDTQIQESGLTPLIHYKEISFDPLTLTPTLHAVSIGSKRAPWLRFTEVKFNALPVTYPKLDIEFQFDDSIQALARDTRHLMQLAGIKTLAGHGRFLSSPQGDNIDSTLTLDIQQVGQLFFTSNLDILDPDFSLHELRSDFLASLALGQLDAMPILYGESVALHNMAFRFQDNGLTRHVWSDSEKVINSEENLLFLKALINNIGLAPYQSIQADHIAAQIQDFLTTPQRLSFSMMPKQAIKLATLMTLFQNKSLYRESEMNLAAR